MNTKLGMAMIALGAICAGTAMAKTVGTFGDDDPLPFVRPGMFMLQDGQQEGIANHNTMEPYQICVGKAGKTLRQGEDGMAKTERNVALTVMYDGKNATVAPGTCSDFSAKQITVTPASTLGHDEVLMGRYKHLR